MTWSAVTVAATACLLAANIVQGAYYGKLIQSGWGASPQYDLAGDIYAANDNTIQIIGFNYNGGAPGAVFYLGTDKDYATARPSNSDPTAVVIANPDGNFEELRAYSNEDIVLRLPEGKVITDYTYISVWCEAVSVYFGGADIPADFVAPKPQVIGQFTPLAHDVSSGDITVLDDKTIEIKNFVYDGAGPDAFFYVGVSDTVSGQSDPYGAIPDETGSQNVLGPYTGQDIVLTLPGDLSFTELKWLSVWCISFNEDFGNIFFPADLNVPAAGFQEQGSDEVDNTYYGKLIHSGFGASPAHELSGDTYAVDETTFQIIDFTFDGNAPAAVFLLGTDKSYASLQSSSAVEDPTATIIENPQGNFKGLRAYRKEDIVLTLPAGTVLSDYTYISVWCRNFSVFFGGFDIPQGFVPPKPQAIGQFRELAHDVSGDVTVLDEKTVEIKNFHYDGQGPDAYFYVGITDTVIAQMDPYGNIPDENGNTGVLGRYTGQDIVLTLPGSLSFRDIKWLSVWCVQFDADFGNIFFPADLDIPPTIDTSIAREDMNCEALSDDLQISWIVLDDMITFELSGNIDRSTDYMAFGLSGSDSTFSMFNADVVVADWQESEPRAIDYFITGYSQCSVNGGACPDTSESNQAVNDAKNPMGEITDGVVRIRYTRALNTGETPTDKEYKVDGTAQQIVWAIGPLNTNGEAAKHPTGKRISSAKTINFGRQVLNNCPSFVTKEEVEKPAFLPHHLFGEEGTVFTAEIGQAASEQGYQALTGQPSWGIAWYINGILIPELHLQRGRSYTFRVRGGTDPALGAKYHPLYFTNDVEGGFEQKQNSPETIYPGAVNGTPADFATGGYCEWKLTEQAIQDAADGKIYQTFEEFKDDLTLSCDDPEYTEFTFTPDAQTPDIVYYQCYTHKSLGWKIHVYDVLPDPETILNPGSSAARTSVLSLFTLVISSLFAYLFL